MGKKNKKHQQRAGQHPPPEGTPTSSSVGLHADPQVVENTTAVVDDGQPRTVVAATSHRRSFSSPAHTNLAGLGEDISQEWYSGECHHHDATSSSMRLWSALFGNGGWHQDGRIPVGVAEPVETGYKSSVVSGDDVDGGTSGSTHEEQLVARTKLKEDSGFLRLQLGKQLQILEAKRQKQQQQEARALATREAKLGNRAVSIPSNDGSASFDSPKSNSGNECLNSSSVTAATDLSPAATGRDRLALQAKKKIVEDNTTVPATTTTTGKYAVQQYREQAVHWQIKAEQLEETLRNIENRHAAELTIKDDSYREQLQTAHQRIEDMKQNSEKETKKRLEAEENITIQKSESQQLRREHNLLQDQYRLEKEKFQQHHLRLVPLQQKVEEFEKKDREGQKAIERTQGQLQKALDEKQKLERALRQRESEVEYYKHGKGFSESAEYHSDNQERLGKIIAEREGEIERLKVQLRIKEDLVTSAEKKLRDSVVAGVNNQRKWQNDQADLRNEVDALRTREQKLKEQLSKALSSAAGSSSSKSTTEASGPAATSMAHMNAMAELQRECDRLKADGEILREELRRRNEENARLREEMKSRASETAAIQEGFKESVQATTLLVLQDAEDKEAITRERILEKELGARMALRHYEQTEVGLLGVSIFSSSVRSDSPTPPRSSESSTPASQSNKQQIINSKKQRKGK